MTLGVREGEWPLCLMENGRTGMPAPTKKRNSGWEYQGSFHPAATLGRNYSRREEAGVMGLYWG